MVHLYLTTTLSYLIWSTSISQPLSPIRYGPPLSPNHYLLSDMVHLYLTTIISYLIGSTANCLSLYATANCLSFSFCNYKSSLPSDNTTILSSLYLFPINRKTFFPEVSILCAIICIIPCIFSAIRCICNSCFKDLSPTLEYTSPFVLNVTILVSIGALSVYCPILAYTYFQCVKICC